MTPWEISVNRIRLLMEVPEWVQTGLSSGDLVRKGGVVRHASGTTTGGQLVCFLRESSGLSSALQSMGNSPPTPGAGAAFTQVQQLTSLSSTLVGLQALNLGLTVAGFAVILSKLKQIDRKLSKILASLDQLGNEIRWLDRRFDFQILADLYSSIESARLGQLSQDVKFSVGSIQAALPQVTRARIHLHLIVDAMIDEGQLFSRPQLLLDYLQSCLVAAMAECRMRLTLGDMECSRVLLGESADALTRQHQAYLDLVGLAKSGEIDLAPDLNLGTRLKELRGFMTESRDRLEGHRSEVEFLQSSNLSLQEWEGYGADIEEPRLLALVPVDSAS